MQHSFHCCRIFKKSNGTASARDSQNCCLSRSERTARLCSLSPLHNEIQQDAFKPSGLWLYHTNVQLLFCWILYFPIVPESSQQPENIHHLHFILLLLCSHAITGPFVEIIQTTGQNWSQQNLIWIESRAGLVDSVSVIVLANVRQIWHIFFISVKFSNLDLKFRIYEHLKSRVVHLGTVILGPKAAEVSFFPSPSSPCPSPADSLSVTARVSEHLGL